MENKLLSEGEFRSFKSKDPQAFRVVYDRYYRLVLYIAKRCGGDSTSCDDIVQETFIRLYKHTDKINDPTHIKNWASMTARNLAMDQVRKRNVENNFTRQELLEEEEQENIQQTHSLQQNDTLSSKSDIHELELSLLGELIDKVTIEIKDNTFSLFYRDGLSAKQIAAEKNVPVSTITNRLSRLRKRFRLYFEQHIKQLHENII